MSRNFKQVVLGLSVVVVLVIFLGGFGPAGVNSSTPTDDAYRQMGVYEEVLHKIQTDYVTEPSIPEVTTGALHGLLESLDADSSYLTADEYKQYLAHQNEGTAQVGLNVSERSGYATVVSVIPGSPADAEHIQDGDIIESIGGKSTYEMSVAMIRLLLEGKPGTDVTFDLIRPAKAEPDKITLTRALDKAPPLKEQEYENSSILYIKPFALNRERVDQTIARLKAMDKNQNKKILLDLRDVAQGDAQQGLRLANAFIGSGTLASVHGQTISTQTFTAQKDEFVTSAPLVVLVNHGTAGPAELVAGAILDSKRGDVVGDRTFGEGVVQKTINLPDGAAVILSVGKYETPSGKKIEDVAVTPNVVVTESIDEVLAEEDEQPGVQQNIPHPDDQLNKGLDILKQKPA